MKEELSPRLLIATGNQGKLKEFSGLLGRHFQCISLNDPSFTSVTCSQVVEDGQTYFENCLKKAITYYESYRIPVLADDSGLEVDGLQGAPGVYSARFGGEGISWPARWELLISRLQGIELRGWSARFRCVLCFYDGQDVPHFFQGTSNGRIVVEPRGNEGFGYDPIFFSNELGMTFGEAGYVEKESVSHRGVAARAFLLWKESSCPDHALDRLKHGR